MKTDPLSSDSRRRRLRLITNRRWHPIALFIIILAIFSAAMPQLLRLAAVNRQAVAVLRLANPTVLPWAQPQWWVDQCDDSSPKQMTSTDLQPQPFQCSAATPHCTHIIAWQQTIAGQCQSAIDMLTSASPSTHNALTDYWLAYLYAASGDWQAAARTIDVGALALTDAKLGQYWANVFERAGVAAFSHDTAQQAAAWFEAGDKLTFRNSITGSVSLMEHELAQDDLSAAFLELRYLLAQQPAKVNATEILRYVMLRRAFVLDQVQRHPGNAAWQRMAQKYATQTVPDGKPRRLDTLPEPDVVVREPWDENWRLEGFDVDLDDLMLGPLVRVTLYWRMQTDGASPIYWIVETTVRNMIPDGNYSWRPAVEHTRPLMANVVYSSPRPFPYNISTEGDKQLFCLDHGADKASSGVAFPSFQLPFGARLLALSGVYRSSIQAAPIVGVRLQAESGDETLRRIVLPDGTAANKRFHTTFSLAEGVSASVQLLHYAGQGSACFGEMLAFVVPAPPINTR